LIVLYCTLPMSSFFRRRILVPPRHSETIIPLVWMINLVLAYALAFGMKVAVLARLLSQRFERPSKPFCKPPETSH
jgi:hypothetical protein